MLVWVGLDVVLIVSNGLLYSWASSVLMVFPTVLTAMYAYVLYQRKSSDHSTNCTAVDSFNPSEVPNEPPVYAVTDTMTIGGKPVLETDIIKYTLVMFYALCLVGSIAFTGVSIAYDNSHWVSGFSTWQSKQPS